jgi:hypothetical protein
MRQLIRLLIIVLIIGTGFPVLLHGQTRAYEGPDDPAGDPAAERETHMDGNRFRIYLHNSGTTGHWGYLDGSKWPATSEKGLDMYDDCRVIIGSRVYLKNDSIPVTDLAEIASNPDIDTLYTVESTIGDHCERSPDGTQNWILTPIFGYFNELSESPAISIDPNTWPPAGWPSRGDELKWPGEWNGRFGRGVQYAQLESYTVSNDAQDQEFVEPTQPLKYFPRRIYDEAGNIDSEVLIGDKRSDVTTNKGHPWGGLGLRVELRGYQWDNPQTRDAVFWEYNIANISEYDLLDVIFGYYMDMGIGHYILVSDGEDDVGSFNAELDLSFRWDTNGVGDFNYPVGALGFAFLESPGISNDQTDNDNDGLIDEKRDNVATTKIGPLDGITDIDAFLTAYGIGSVDDLKEHWDADEDQDWRDGNDVNGNGRYDSGETFGDDIGLDGVGPGDLNYRGPDADGTECNHKPDLLIGQGCEPNFGLLDISESDMLGLQTYHLFRHPQDAPPQVMHDQECYEMLSDQILDDSYLTPSNLYQGFGTGPFRLNKGQTERISMATVAAFENLENLNDLRIAPIIFERKKVVQTIYESDYRFARPPEMPTLNAIAGDGQVFLFWDDRADKLTREPLAAGANDFEGYKLYKATDRFFDDALKLRDGFGNPAGLVPIRQWDLRNDFQGHTDYALVEGEGFYLGSNSGIQHYYLDTNVENGRTYYYFLAAYDHGLESKNIAPSENVPTIKVDENEIINFLSPNVQVVVPHTPSTGYVAPQVEILHDPDAITGPAETFGVTIVNPDAVKPDHIYKMVFDVDTVATIGSATNTAPRGAAWLNNGFKIFDATSDTLIYYEDQDNYIKTHIIPFDTAGSGYGQNISWYLLKTGEVLETDVFDGIQVSFELPMRPNGLSSFDSLNSGWLIGNNRRRSMNLTVYHDNIQYFPYDMDIIFTGEDETYTSILSRRGRVATGTDTVIASDQYLLGESFHFYVEDKVNKDENGNYLKLDIVAIDMNGNELFDLMEDELFVGYSDYNERFDLYLWTYSLFSINFREIAEDNMPEPGDIYRLHFNRPFALEDTLVFRIPQVSSDADEPIHEDLDQITVVPNPYIVTNTLEPAVRNNQLNQRRRIMFTNLPSQCTIKIFTMSGYLVDTIDVMNTLDYGIAYWDLLSKEDLEVAAGIYLYHVKSVLTGKEKIGKFAIIK